ncbi:hypothetical protein AAVH_34374, partial [Aphelenchoides avenae]
MADAQERQQIDENIVRDVFKRMEPSLQLSRFLDLDPRLYQPQRHTKPRTCNAVVFYKLPTYAVLFVPSMQEFAILNPNHLTLP